MKKAALVGVALSISVTAWAAGRNLKFYAKDIAPEQLKTEMKTIKVSLGTKCVHCHKQDDWSADHEKKAVALGMLEMTKKIGKELFTDEYFPEEGAPRATCFVCHQGKEKVELAPANPDAEKRFNDGIARGRHKETVEAMKRLVERLNKDFFTWEGAPRATCWMCHRGRDHAKTKPPKLGEDDAEEKAVDWGFKPAPKAEEKKPADDEPF